jgi:hypothetical protein
VDPVSKWTQVGFLSGPSFDDVDVSVVVDLVF